MLLAWTADALTSLRLVIAVILAPVIAARSLDWAAVLVTIAWFTDFFDGRVARSTDTPTRLGDWDLRIDASVGIGLLIGMGTAGYTPWWAIGALIVVLGGTTVAFSNPSPAMLLLAFAYGWFLWLMLVEDTLVGWLPFAAIPFIALFDWSRFIRVILPAFFHGIATLARREPPKAAPVLDDWV